MGAETTIGSVTVLEKISSGEGGTLFLARQAGLDRTVQLRKLGRELLESPALVERFRREARLTAQVQHPNVLQIYDFFAERGDYYLVLEAVDGLTLREILDLAGKLPFGIAVRIGLELAQGVEEMHRRGILHCDIRPENVRISRWGEVKLCGLASAREVSEADPPAPAELTPYMAPELRKGQGVERRTDSYSLALLVGEMLCGRKPPKSQPALGRRPRLGATLRRAARERPSDRPELRSLIRALRRSIRDENGDPRLEIAAWLWEARMFVPAEAPAAPAASPLQPIRLPAPQPAPPTPAQPRELLEIEFHPDPPTVLEALQQEPVASPPVPEPRAMPSAEPTPSPSPPFRKRRTAVSGERILPIAIGAAAAVMLVVAFALREEPDTLELPRVAAPPPATLGSPSMAGSKGRISFVAIPWAEVQIGDAEPFLTPRAAPVELPAGEHLLSFRHPRYGEEQRTLVVRAGEERVVRHVFSRSEP